jgi:hypothetical protein
LTVGTIRIPKINTCPNLSKKVMYCIDEVEGRGKTNLFSNQISIKVEKQLLSSSPLIP